VGDLHQVVDLGAAADFGAAELGPVDADARADFHVIFDDHRADLRNLHVLLAVPAIPKPIAAQHAAGVDDHAVADGDALADDDVGEKFAAVADDHIVADDHAGVEDRSAAYRRTLADDDVGGDGDVFAEDGGGSDAGACIDAGFGARDRGSEEFEHFRLREIGIVDDKQGRLVAMLGGGEMDRFFDDDGGGLGLFEVLQVLVGAEEGDVGFCRV